MAIPAELAGGPLQRSSEIFTAAEHTIVALGYAAGLPYMVPIESRTTNVGEWAGQRLDDYSLPRTVAPQADDPQKVEDDASKLLKGADEKHVDVKTVVVDKDGKPVSGTQ